MPVSNIIAFCGNSGAGKDTCAEILQELAGESVARVAFADPLRAALPLFGLGPESYASQEAKQKPGPLGVSYRQAMQALGDLCRFDLPHRVPDLQQKPTLVERLVELKCREHAGKTWDDPRAHRIVITDVRNRDEVAAVQRLGGTVIFLERPHFANMLSESEKGHSSETRVAETRALADYVVRNDSTLDELKTKLAELVAPKQPPALA